jgi:hypothetical protein
MDALRIALLSIWPVALDYRHAFNCDEGSGCIVLTNAAFIMAHSHIDHPKHAIADGRAASNDRSKLSGELWQIGSTREVCNCLTRGSKP